MKEMKLSEFAEEYLLDEKLFIVPTRSIGLLMINDMAKKGKSSLNLNPITLRRLSEEICERYIEENNILVIDDILGKSLILDCLKELEDEEDSFFKSNLIDEKTAEEVYRVVIELKSKKIKDFPKEKDLDKIFSLYNSKLKEVNGMDVCDIIIKAMDVKELELFKKKVIGVAGNIEFHYLERELFKELNNGGVKIKMPVQYLKDSPKEYFFKDSADNLDLNKKICFFSEFGIRNEIKYVMEDILKKDIPLDEVVIAYTDPKYIEAIDLEFQKEDLGISFAEGLDILKSTCYRFIKTLFNFSKGYYNIEEIKPIFFDGSLAIEDKFKVRDKTISAEEIYDEFIKCKVFYGRENYNKLNFIPSELNYESNIKREWLKQFFADILFVLPQTNAKFRDSTERLIFLIKKYVNCRSSYDKTAKETILENLKTIGRIPLEVKRDEYFDILLSYLEEIKINRSGAAPSKVFACKYNNAGYTGREHLYLIGLDSDSLASKIVESPILLDNIRMDISSSLTFSRESYKYKNYKLRETLTAPFKDISVGYSNFDMVDVKGKTPSKIYTELKEEYENIESCKSEPKILRGKDLVNSGTSLEILGQCSRKLYLNKCMDLKEKEDAEVNLDRWLDPLNKGLLVHEVLNRFFNLQETQRLEENLLIIIEEECIEAEKQTPYILEEVYNKEKVEIKSFCREMVEREKVSGLEVFINELTFGKDKNNAIFGKLKAQIFKIGDLSLKITGSIDRVDIDRTKQTFKIVDYKTGSLKNFEKRLRKSEGRGKNKTYDYSNGQKFQFFIYKNALENIIKTRKEFKDFTVESFSYEFKEGSIDLDFNDEFIQMIENRIKNLLEIDILEADKSIVYDETDELTCKYCEFKNICKADRENFNEEEDALWKDL